MIKKKNVALITALSLLMVNSMSYAAVKPVPVAIFVNDAQLATYDSEVKKDLPAMIYNGRTLMPLKKTFELFGLTLKWDAKNKTIETLTEKGETIWIQIGNKNAKVAGKTVSLDVPAQIIDSRTYVPLAFIAKAVGHEAQWDGVNKIVKLYTDGTEVLNFAAIPEAFGKTPNRVNDTIFFDGANGKMISITETDLDLTNAVNMMSQVLNIQANDFVLTNTQAGRQIAAFEDQFAGQVRTQLIAEKDAHVFIIEIRGLNKTEATNIVKQLLK